jgi:hypothetical protein
MKINGIFVIILLGLTKVSYGNETEIRENLVEKECNSELIKIIDKYDKKFSEINLFNGAKIVKNNDKDLYTKIYGNVQWSFNLWSFIRSL